MSDVAHLGDHIVIMSEPRAVSDGLLSPTRANELRSLFSSYLLNLKRGRQAVRQMIIRDICFALEIGATKRANDLSLVLQKFVSLYPETCG